MPRSFGAVASRIQANWLGLLAAVVAVGQTALAYRSRNALPEFPLSIVAGWAAAMWLARGSKEARPSARWALPGAVLVTLGLLELWPDEYRALHRFAPLLAGLGLALSAGIPHVRRNVRSVSMLLLPVILPVPRGVREVAESYLSLSALTARTAELTLHVLGEPVARKGALLHLSHADLLVGSICAGENHIAAMLVLLALATMLFSLTLPQKLWFAGSAIVVGFSCNAVRIAALAVFADRGQMERFTSWHDGQLSPLCMGIAALLTLGLWWPVLRRAPAAPQ